VRAVAKTLRVAKSSLEASLKVFRKRSKIDTFLGPQAAQTKKNLW